MKKILTLGASLLVLPAAPVLAADPFAAVSTLPYHAPPFDRIKDSDYQPAFEEGMKQQRAEIDAIAANPATPTFDNTIAAMERSGRMLDRVNNAFNGVVQANTNPELDKVQSDEAPKLAVHNDAIYLNAKLFARVKAIYDARASLKLDGEGQQLLKIYYRQFIHAGANLNEAGKTRLREINQREATLEAAFEQQLIAATKAGALVLDDKSQLAGLSDGEIANAAHEAESRKLKGKFVIPLQNTTQQPSLLSLADRDVREKLFNARWTATEKGGKNDTRPGIAEMAQLRAEKARLLGYPNYAAYVLYDQMARHAAEGGEIPWRPDWSHRRQGEGGGGTHPGRDRQGATHFDLKPWDWQRYAERVRKARYDLDENQIKPYLEVNSVLQNGVFYAANRLYGLTFKQRRDIPVYQSDVMVFEVFDQDGSPLGLMYFDYFKRDNKAGGAWMSNFVGQSKLWAPSR